MADLLKGMREQPRIERPPVVEDLEIDAERAAVAQEIAQEKKDSFLEEEPEEEAPLKPERALEKQPAGATPAPVVAAKPVRVADEVTVEVERVLEEGLGDFYATLSPSDKVRFKKKGEEASTEITTMVRKLKINVKRALQLVRDWLLTIPKANKFFLEQEAKIKVDKITQLIEARKEAQFKQP